LKRCTTYIVKRYTVSKARERFADVLDEADRNGSVLIERGHAQYVITPRPAVKSFASRQSVIEILDPAVERGQWTWDLTSKGLRFRPRRRRS